jgi:hypothetical protein
MNFDGYFALLKLASSLAKTPAQALEIYRRDVIARQHELWPMDSLDFRSKRHGLYSHTQYYSIFLNDDEDEDKPKYYAFTDHTNDYLEKRRNAIAADSERFAALSSEKEKKEFRSLLRATRSRQLQTAETFIQDDPCYQCWAIIGGSVVGAVGLDYVIHLDH